MNVKRFDGRVGCEERSINYTCIIDDCTNLSIPTSCENHVLVNMHLAHINRILELKDSLADAQLLYRPFSESAVIRARKYTTNVLNGLKMVDLISVSK